MKPLILVILSMGLIAGCSSNSEKTKAPTAKEQVGGLKKMCAENAGAIATRQKKRSLYLRLGKEAKIRTLATNLYSAHKSNKKIKHMFTDVQAKPFIDNVTAFLVAGTGGKANYKGRDMKTAHAHLKITSEDFMTAGADITKVMKDLKYGDNEVQEVVCALVAFVPVVVVD